MSFGKPDATGRSTGLLTGRQKKKLGPKCLKGEPWAWMPIELMESSPWRARSINLRKLIDFLMIEHTNHAGTENGRLMATYKQLVNYGLSRRLIKEAINEGKSLGLLKHEPGGAFRGQTIPSVFTLTFLPTHDGVAPTNDWKNKTEEYVEARKDGRSETQKRVNKAIEEKQKSRFTSDTKPVPLRELYAAKYG